MTWIYSVIYVAEALVLAAVFRARRIKLFSMYGFALGAIFVVNYIGGALFPFRAVQEYFFGTMGYPVPFTLADPEYFRYFAYSQANLAAWLVAALSVRPFDSAAPRDQGRALAHASHRDAPRLRALDTVLLVGFVTYSLYLASHLSLYQILLGFGDYDALREAAAANLSYFAYVYSKGLALFFSLYLLLVFRGRAVRTLIVVCGLAAAFVTLQKSVPAYYAVAYLLLAVTRRRGSDLRWVSDRTLVIAALAGLSVSSLMSYLAYDVSVGDLVLSIFRRVSLLPHALNYDAILMVDQLHRGEYAVTMSSFPTIEQALFHAQRYYMGSLLEDFTFASGASNATANTFYITALYFDMRYAAVAVSFLLARAFLAVDRWYYTRARAQDPIVIAAYLSLVLGGGKISSSHLGTVLVSEGILFVVAAAALMTAVRAVGRQTTGAVVVPT